MCDGWKTLTHHFFAAIFVVSEIMFTFVGMKDFVFILTIWMALALSSCRHKPYPHKLVMADSISEYDAQRAQAMLDSLKPQMNVADEPTRNYYALMCIKVADKAYKPLPFTDSILDLTHYYEEQRDADLLPVAYYYAGRNFVKQYNYPQALSYFQKSLGIIDESKRASTLKGKLYSQMGEIFLLQLLFDKAVEMYSSALKLDRLYNDYRSQIFNLRDLALCYYNKKEKKSAELYYQEALRLASQHKEEDLVADVSCVLANFYLKTNRLDKAKTYVKKAIEYNDPDDQRAVSLISADIYRATGNVDSAYSICNKLLTMDDIHIKKSALKRLAELYIMKNDASRSLSCVKGYEDMLDSISANNATEELARMDAVFHNQQKEKQISQLKIDKANYQKFFITVCSLIGIVTLGCVIFMLYLRAKRLNVRIKIERKRRLDQDEYERTDEFIRKNKEKIKELEHRITLGSDEDEVAALKNLQKKLRSLNEVSMLRKQEHDKAQSELRNTDEFRMLKRKIGDKALTNKKLPQEEWLSLENAICSRVKDFKKRIEEVCRISDQEYKVCLLLKMQIAPSDIANITNKTRGAISLTRQRLYELAFGQKSSPDGWDKFILSL